MYRKVYDTLYDEIDPNTVPHMVLAVADYSYKSAFVADQEINMLAFMIEIMSQVRFKWLLKLYLEKKRLRTQNAVSNVMRNNIYLILVFVHIVKKAFLEKSEMIAIPVEKYNQRY